MSKRRKFILSSLILASGFVVMQFLPDSYRFISIGILGVVTLLLFIWSLKEGLELNTTLVTLLLPFYFTIAVGLFWFLLPSGVYTRLPIAVLYGIGIYALFLTANIYTVAAIRTIALMRAARGVGFVLTLLTLFLVFDTILSLRLMVYFESLIISLGSFLLFIQGYWSVTLEKKLTMNMVKMSLVAAIVLGEIAAVLFFWPVSVAVGSLFLTVSAYVLLGLGQARLEGRLFSQTVREYLALGIIVFIGMFLATKWG
jgi:hypothetical protein